MNEDVRSGLIRRFLVAGDETERPGRVEKGQVGLDLGGGVEIVDTRANMLRFAREIFARFSGRAFPEGIDDPQVLVTGNPGDGFELFGPSAGSDPGHDRFARQRALEDDCQDCWVLPLQPLSALRPIDGQDEPPIRAGTATDLLDEVDGRDISVDLLDEAVHVVASHSGSNANNGGRDAQAAFLVGQLGYDRALAVVRDLTDEVLA